MITMPENTPNERVASKGDIALAKKATLVVNEVNNILKTDFL